ncbi:SDR family NAD(P)-dependent oxidoreductase [Pasteurella multocida]|uniref:SDR family NAD(P)-dependent oxidoreductase n=1 Tax=Pasteurella multocida TaxID=747 RepID=UPI000E0190A0|nr:SDR family oxidoreductase [Pasteurella multocida]MBM2609648.1 SDR family oxidoreductase [Pasteurella multocida]MDY0501121.1 SDR family oxidoreductase [Pasteurella multocida]MDY0633665.1 SDR family oxidoreductase [Pasteurella multocida]MDY0691754.1 SDR family oxidoreductase [Pasteurella multocida]MEB3476108.1 SDR family oxidoreductase [Pasteurella multocida]
MNNGYILITGASSGIGYQLAKTYAQKGNKLILVARTLAPLVALQQQYVGNIEIIQADLSCLEETRNVYTFTQQRGWFIHTLINNAGVGLLGDFTQTTLEDEIAMVNLNIQSLMILSKLYLQDMMKMNQGHILNVSSVAGEMPGGPQMSVYYATKAFVTSFSQGLSYELRHTGIKVSILAPGPTLTNFVKTATRTENATLFDMLTFQTAETVARYTEKHLAHKKLIIPGVWNKLMVYSHHFLPRTFVIALVSRIQHLKKEK